MFSNWLVGSITGLALVMLFWPLLAKIVGRLRTATPRAA
jgi:putative tricarboxylic transport membrane protein